jgi:hypothetical protein
MKTKSVCLRWCRSGPGTMIGTPFVNQRDGYGNFSLYMYALTVSVMIFSFVQKYMQMQS